jgi:NADH-quinone oxidoreductase subunit N
MSYWELLKLAGPETTVVIAAFAVIVIDFSVLRGQPSRLRMLMVGAFATLGCLAAIALMVVGQIHGQVAGGMFLADPLTQSVKIGLLILTIFTVLISSEADFTDHVGEYFALILLATTGLMFMVGTENLLMLFVALELASLSLYILTAFNKQNPRAAEAALKYFLFGGMAAACTLFGLSLVYGLSGSLNLPDIAAKLRGQETDPLLSLALDRLWFQNRRRAVSSLGAGCLPGGADADRRVDCLWFQAGQFFHPRQTRFSGLCGFGWQRRLATLRDGMETVAGHIGRPFHDLG